jgi:outer membrane biosynthesis protein TonB
MKYYPQEAQQRAIDGLVHIQVTLDTQGRPAQLDFNVKFALAQPNPEYGTTNFESPDKP